MKWSIILDFTICYKDDFLLLNNSKYGDFVERMYPIELEIKDTTDTGKSASCLNWHLEKTVMVGKEQNFQD